MSAAANLLLTVVLLVAVSGMVWLIALVLPDRRGTAGRKDWGKVVGGVLATALGVRTLVTGHIGHWLYSPEMSASDGPAHAIGALLVAMGIVILGSWLNQRRKPGDPDAKVSEDGKAESFESESMGVFTRIKEKKQS